MYLKTKFFMGLCFFSLLYLKISFEYITNSFSHKGKNIEDSYNSVCSL